MPKERDWSKVDGATPEQTDQTPPLNARNFGQEQADATWKAVKYAKWGVIVAAISVFVNGLVVIAAVFVPAYQQSLMVYDREVSEKDDLEDAIYAGYRVLTSVNQFMTEVTNYDECIHKRLNKGTIDYYRSVAISLESDSKEGPYFRTNKLTRTISASAFDSARYYTYSLKLLDWADLPDRCRYAFSLAGTSLQNLRRVLSVTHQAYKVPVRRPFGFLNGAEITPEPLLVDNKILDKALASFVITVEPGRRIKK